MSSRVLKIDHEGVVRVERAHCVYKVRTTEVFMHLPVGLLSCALPK